MAAYVSVCDCGSTSFSCQMCIRDSNMADHGFRVAGYNRSRAVTEEGVRQHPHENLTPFYALEEMVSALARPRRIMLMLSLIHS